MSKEVMFSGKVLMLTAAVVTAVAVLAFVGGCGKEPEAQSQSQAQDHAAMNHEAQMQDHAAMNAMNDQAETEATLIVQETCPVMGGPINDQVFVEYQGKKVYFCCAGCPEKFLANPEQYIAKLPQFQTK